MQCLGFVYNKTNLATDEFLDGFKDTSSFTNCKELLKQLIHYLKNLEVSQLQGVCEMFLSNLIECVSQSFFVHCRKLRTLLMSPAYKPTTLTAMLRTLFATRRDKCLTL